MFEYTALVDAPVKRFTSIVTDPEPEEAPVLVAVLTTTPPLALPLVEAPDLIVAVEPEPVEREAEPIVAAAMWAPIANPTPPPTPGPRVCRASSVNLRDQHAIGGAYYGHVESLRTVRIRSVHEILPPARRVRRW